MAPKSLNKSKISDILKTMDFQNVPIDVTKAKKWLHNHYPGIKIEENSTPKIHPIYIEADEAKGIYEKSTENIAWKKTSNYIKTECLYKFSKEIESNIDELCQLMFIASNILPKDGKSDVEQLKNYLQYYSIWIEQESDDFNNENVVLCLINEEVDFSLTEIGFILGSILAGGRNIIFSYKNPLRIIPIHYLIELSIKAGIPKGTILHVNTENDVLKELCPIQIHKNIKINNSEAFNNKKLLIMPHLKTSMIVFNDADIDSAIETSIRAIWGYEGRLPWSVDTLLIQEDIVKKFTEKLKNRLKKLQFNEVLTASDDVSITSNETLKGKLDKIEKEAKTQGIEIFKPKDSCKNCVIPTLFLGGKASGNKIMSEFDLEPPSGTILAFRTPKEAVNLANNSKQGLAVSLWTQNSSLINEIVRKLDVGTVWVNSYGIIKANVGFTTRKYEGIGYFGGNEGFYEFNELIHTETTEELKKSSSILLQSKKAQDSWNKLTFNKRVENVFKLVRNNTEWISKLYNVIKNLETINTSQTIDNFDLKTYRDPIGVVIVNKSNEIVPEIVLVALLLGNTVLILDDNNGFIDELIKNSPSGVLGRISASELGALECLKQHVVVIGGDKSIPRSFLCQKMYDFKGGDLFKFILRRCTFKKNVWSDVGESF